MTFLQEALRSKTLPIFAARPTEPIPPKLEDRKPTFFRPDGLREAERVMPDVYDRSLHLMEKIGSLKAAEAIGEPWNQALEILREAQEKNALISLRYESKRDRELAAMLTAMGMGGIWGFGTKDSSYMLSIVFLANETVARAINEAKGRPAGQEASIVPVNFEPETLKAIFKFDEISVSDEKIIKLIQGLFKNFPLGFHGHAQDSVPDIFQLRGSVQIIAPWTADPSDDFFYETVRLSVRRAKELYEDGIQPFLGITSANVSSEVTRQAEAPHTFYPALASDLLYKDGNGMVSPQPLALFVIKDQWAKSAENAKEFDKSLDEFGKGAQISSTTIVSVNPNKLKRVGINPNPRAHGWKIPITCIRSGSVPQEAIKAYINNLHRDNFVFIINPTAVRLPVREYPDKPIWPRRATLQKIAKEEGARRRAEKAKRATALEQPEQVFFDQKEIREKVAI